MDTVHSLKFNNIHRLPKVKGYMYRVVKEAIQLQLHLNNLNRENGFILGKTWQPLLLQLCNNTVNHFSSSVITQSITIETKHRNLQTLPTNSHWLTSNYEPGYNVGI
jgi:hypothetical protein